MTRRTCSSLLRVFQRFPRRAERGQSQLRAQLLPRAGMYGTSLPFLAAFAAVCSACRLPKRTVRARHSMARTLSTMASQTPAASHRCALIHGCPWGARYEASSAPVRTIYHNAIEDFAQTVFVLGCIFCQRYQVRSDRAPFIIIYITDRGLSFFYHNVHNRLYKAERLGMEVVLREERHSSKTCPACEHRRKNHPQGRMFHCTNPQCGWTGHQGGVGAVNTVVNVGFSM
jgi:hypothetical protein